MRAIKSPFLRRKAKAVTTCEPKNSEQAEAIDFRVASSVSGIPEEQVCPLLQQDRVLYLTSEQHHKSPPVLDPDDPTNALCEAFSTFGPNTVLPAPSMTVHTAAAPDASTPAAMWFSNSVAITTAGPFRFSELQVLPEIGAPIPPYPALGNYSITQPLMQVPMGPGFSTTFDLRPFTSPADGHMSAFPTQRSVASTSQAGYILAGMMPTPYSQASTGDLFQELFDPSVLVGSALLESQLDLTNASNLFDPGFTTGVQDTDMAVDWSQVFPDLDCPIGPELG
jgi:hypothetical protein